jgi:hypothetical protein
MPKAPKPLHVPVGSKQHTKGRPARSEFSKRQKRKPVALINEKQNMTPTRWQKVIEATAHGANRKEAARAAKISKRTIDAYLISNVSAYSQLREAHLLHLRRAWPTDKVEKILVKISMGDSLKVAAEKLDVKKKELSGLYTLLLKDRTIRKMYDEARELQAESFVDEIISIADDSDNDRLENGRINHEVVNRSKLKVDTRKWVMGSMVKRRFGEHKHVEHSGDLNINHAAVLSGGRKRLEKLHAERTGQAPKKPEPGTVTIEGEAQATT